MTIKSTSMEGQDLFVKDVNDITQNNSQLNCSSLDNDSVNNVEPYGG